MESTKQLPPLVFSPIAVPRMWGGTRLGEAVDQIPIGESWLLSAIPGYETRVKHGPYQGATLRELLEPPHFPLLIKLIDTAMPLSVQVHPDDKLAHQLGLPAGKSEMWYILHSGENAHLLVGLSKSLSKGALERLIRNDTLPQSLNRITTRPHEYYHIPAGQIHSIGAQQLLLEIQQSSDTTYRLSDFGRVDQQGNRRELHVEEGIRASSREARAVPQPLTIDRQPDHSAHLIVEDPHFLVQRDFLKASSSTPLPLTPPTAAQCIIPIEGSLSLTCKGFQQELALYEPVLITDTNSVYQLNANTDSVFLTVSPQTTL